VIDPGVAPRAPTLTAYELVDGDYQELAVVTGAERFEATRPFPLTVVPIDLLDD
jgi:hypothetical protein